MLTWNYMEHLGNFAYFLGLCILDGPLTNFATNFHKISIISSKEGGNRWTIDEISDSQATQAKLTHTKDELFKPSQANLEEQV